MKTEHIKMYEDLKNLLVLHASNGYAKNVLAVLVAKKSLEMNHLYQDMGFKSRAEMGKFMMNNFLELAKQKPKDKLWKKFLYEQIDAIAPACVSCNDQESCFRCLLSELSA
ncbi:MAG: nitrogen fixation protein NifQ [Sulfurimonas sp.]|jgi:nitrogen fixation protein NifQ